MEVITEHKVRELRERQREYFMKGETLSFKFRVAQLMKLRKAISEYEEELRVTLYKDLGESDLESYTCEVGFILSSINLMNYKYILELYVDKLCNMEYTK